MKQETFTEILQWLNTSPSLDELCSRYPEDWSAVQDDVSAIVGRGIAQELQTYLARLSSEAAMVRPASGKRQQNSEAVLGKLVRSRMAHESVKKLCLGVLAADAGVAKGKLRFNLFNGFVAQRLLFSQELTRKPVSLFWFRLFWPLVWQRKRLMPLVQSKGIYCFYSRELIVALADRVASRSCLEIAAGDGTLSRFLMDRGVAVTATDNHGWSNAVAYPEWVIKCDAAVALKTYAPEVVICSWPPALNDFERMVFRTSSVQLYIVIGSRHQVAFGNWKDYQSQSDFAIAEDKELGALVLPPELGAAVYVFRRKPRG